MIRINRLKVLACNVAFVAPLRETVLPVEVDLGLQGLPIINEAIEREREGGL